MKMLLITIPKLSNALSDGKVIRSLKLIIALWYFTITRKLKLIKKDFLLNGHYNKKPITFYLRYPMDTAALREVFIDKEYGWCPIENPKTIIDLGAHFGDTALYYAARFPSSKIIAVEPSPENYARLVQHTKNNPNIIAVQAAVGGVDGEINLYIMPSSLGHSIINRKGSREAITVKKLSLQTLFRNNDLIKADLIKFDIEGAEFELFKTVKPKDFATAYIGELHYDLINESGVDFESFFSGFHIEKTMLQNDKRYLVKIN